MPRPDIKDQRREQILDAFERCIAIHGVAGAGLDLIAKEAGLARALIRHNIGNREDLLTAAVARFTERTSAEWRATLAQLPVSRRHETLVDWLFDPKYSDPDMVRISDALITACAPDPALAADIRGWLDGFIGDLVADIRMYAGEIGDEDATAVSAGIIAAYFSYDSTTILGEMDRHRLACRRAAMMLVERLAI